MERHVKKSLSDETIICNLQYLHQPPKDAVELVDMQEVLGHVRGEHHVDYALPHKFIAVAVKLLEDVHALV